MPAASRDGFCIYIETLCQGPVPLVADDERYVVFESETEAQKEVADHAITRLQEFLDGARDFEDAITIEEYVMPFTVHGNETITDADGNSFDLRVP